MRLTSMYANKITLSSPNPRIVAMAFLDQGEHVTLFESHPEIYLSFDQSHFIDNLRPV